MAGGGVPHADALAVRGEDAGSVGAPGDRASPVGGEGLGGLAGGGVPHADAVVAHGEDAGSVGAPNGTINQVQAWISRECPWSIPYGNRSRCNEYPITLDDRMTEQKLGPMECGSPDVDICEIALTKYRSG